MLINNVASTAVVKMVVLKAVLTMNNDNDCDNDDDNYYDNDGNHCQPVLLQSVCCGSHEYRRLGDKQLECPMINDDILIFL